MLYYLPLEFLIHIESLGTVVYSSGGTIVAGGDDRFVSDNDSTDLSGEAWTILRHCVADLIEVLIPLSILIHNIPQDSMIDSSSLAIF